MALTDAQAKAALRTWPLVTRIWSGGETVDWLRGQPKSVGDSHRSPRLTVPGSLEFQTQPDGLWIAVGECPFVDCIVVEVCGNAQNLNDKRARYSARTSALVLEMRQPWLDAEVTRQGGGTRTRRVLLGRDLSEHGVVSLPVRHLRVLYALDDSGATSLYVRATRSMVMEGHEYVLPQRLLGQYNAQNTQGFLKRMAPRRQYL